MRNFPLPALLLFLLPIIARTQCMPPEQRTWIDYTDNSTFTERVWFGFSDSASYGLDLALCEIEIPPVPPPGPWDIRFINIPGREGWDTPQGLGQGFFDDYRARSSQDGRDTFQLHLFFGTGAGSARLAWSVAGILSIVDSAMLGGVPMHIVNHFDITASGFYSLMMVTFRSPLSVEEPSGGQAASYILQQNYPNPFNPATTIEYTIPGSVGTLHATSLHVFDLLGRPIATLVDGEQCAGVHEVRWDAAGVPSGVYFCRLITPKGTMTRKMLLLR